MSFTPSIRREGPALGLSSLDLPAGANPQPVLSEAEKVKARLKRLRARRGASHSKNWNRENPEKRRAQKRVEYALKVGKLVRQACERCGATQRVQAHHDDYTRPLEVMWLCPIHHGERHRELRCIAA